MGRNSAARGRLRLRMSEWLNSARFNMRLKSAAGRDSGGAENGHAGLLVQTFKNDSPVFVRKHPNAMAIGSNQRGQAQSKILKRRVGGRNEFHFDLDGGAWTQRRGFRRCNNGPSLRSPPPQQRPADQQKICNRVWT